LRQVKILKRTENTLFFVWVNRGKICEKIERKYFYFFVRDAAAAFTVDDASRIVGREM
jgi:hypothetical protein